MHVLSCFEHIRPVMTSNKRSRAAPPSFRCPAPGQIPLVAEGSPVTLRAGGTVCHPPQFSSIGFTRCPLFTRGYNSAPTAGLHCEAAALPSHPAGFHRRSKGVIAARLPPPHACALAVAPVLCPSPSIALQRAMSENGHMAMSPCARGTPPTTPFIAELMQ